MQRGIIPGSFGMEITKLEYKVESERYEGDVNNMIRRNFTKT